jgi:hypothetical protein
MEVSRAGSRGAAYLDRLIFDEASRATRGHEIDPEGKSDEAAAERGTIHAMAPSPAVEVPLRLDTTSWTYHRSRRLLSAGGTRDRSSPDAFTTVAAACTDPAEVPPHDSREAHVPHGRSPADTEVASAAQCDRRRGHALRTLFCAARAPRRPRKFISVRRYRRGRGLVGEPETV